MDEAWAEGFEACKLGFRPTPKMDFSIRTWGFEVVWGGTYVVIE